MIILLLYLQNLMFKMHIMGSLLYLFLYNYRFVSTYFLVACNNASNHDYLSFSRRKNLRFKLILIIKECSFLAILEMISSFLILFITKVIRLIFFLAYSGLI